MLHAAGVCVVVFFCKYLFPRHYTRPVAKWRINGSEKFCTYSTAAERRRERRTPGGGEKTTRVTIYRTSECRTTTTTTTIGVGRITAHRIYTRKQYIIILCIRRYSGPDDGGIVRRSGVGHFSNA